jgi:hypothetical protein
MLTLAGVAVSTGLAAQPAPTDAGAAAANEADEDLYVLSPFEVTTDKDSGYMATSTLAGTRIRTDLADVGSAISVVTKEMMDDLGATDSSTLLQYTTNAEVSGTRSTYAGMGNSTTLDENESLRSPGGARNRIRGLSSADNVRDYFASDIPWDGYNVDRIDIQRGANSLLFGLGSPAGIVNASMDSAKFTNSGEVSLRTGSFGSFRSNIDINQQILENQLAVRIEGLWNNKKFKQQGSFEKDRRIYGAVRYEPKFLNTNSFHTTIKANYENGSINANRPRVLPPIDNISAWFRSPTVSASNPFGGLGKLVINNPYDAEYNDTSITTKDGKGQIPTADPDYNAWVSAVGNQQTPLYKFNGKTGELSQIYAGFLNIGARTDTGGDNGKNGIEGKQYSDLLYGVSGVAGYATSAHLPGYQYGQYKNQTMTDSSIFNFYDTLLDGNNKGEYEDWNTYNINISQTAFDERFGLDLSYDYQDYRRGGWSLLGGAPAITIDYLQTLQDFSTNPNVGRAYVTGTGSGSQYSSTRTTVRANLFAELRADDFLQNSFLVKLINRQRFNVVFSKDRLETESRGYYLYSKSLNWDNYWNGTTDKKTEFYDRSPVAVIYLGGSLLNAPSSAGANIPGIQSDITINSGNVYAFDTTWTGGTNFGDPWVVPSSLSYQYHFNTDPTSTNYNPPLQNSNPDNYKGWNSDYYLDIDSFAKGSDHLWSSASKTLRDTTSTVGVWQGFLWDGALVGTVGWRSDKVQNKAVVAHKMTNQRSELYVGSDAAYATSQGTNAYVLPDDYESDFFGHSLGWSGVLHINKLLPRDFLPFNLSLAYNKSDNFQVTSQRTDILGTPLDNPTGDTKDYGFTISTKDNRFVLRVLKYESTYKNASSYIDTGFLTGAVAIGLTWTNIMRYDLGGYTMNTVEDHDKGADEYRYNFNAGVGNIPANATYEELAAYENASIAEWQKIFTYINTNYPGFFKAWNIDYGSNETPNVHNYGTGTAPSGYTTTADQTSKGYEYELTANITKNWRLAFNAAKTEASQTNIGGTVVNELVNYMDAEMATIAGDMARWGGSTVRDQFYNASKGSWTLAKLQDGAAMTELRKWRFNLITNYSFDEGTLKGFGFGGGYRWQDKSVIGYPVVAKSSTVFAYDMTNPYYSPYENAVDLWISYERPLSEKVFWSIQLNVTNAFGKDQLVPISVQPDGKSIASARIEYGAEWFLSTSLKF